MKNPYRKILEREDLGVLKKVIEIKDFKIKNNTETERLKIFVEFIANHLKEDKIKVNDLIKNLCLLEKALASEINGKVLVNERTGKRFQARGSFDHYHIIIIHALRKIGLSENDNLILTKDQLNKISKVVWH